MVDGVAAIVLWTQRFDEVVAFYRELGLPLEDEQHDDGPRHAACSVDGVHIAIYPASYPGAKAQERLAAGATMVGFMVRSLEDAVEAATQLGAPIAVEPEDVPWGRRAVVVDPDGRSVELCARKESA